MKHVLLLAVACIMAAGCATFGLDSDTEERAGRHMALADSLEQASTLDEATLEYQIVAQHYPSSSAYLDAVRKTGLLFAHPENPMRNDSLAQYWIRTYLDLPDPLPDRQGAQTELLLLERISTLQHNLLDRERTADSLLALMKKQEAQVSGHTQQLQTLQAELRQVRQELNQLKQVDVDINKSRRK